VSQHLYRKNHHETQGNFAAAGYGFGRLAFAQQQQTKSIILDTDIGPDYDDVGAMAILHALADKGECHILATVASNQHNLISPVLSVLNTCFKRPGIPVGVVRGKAVNIPCSQKWDSLIVARYPHRVPDRQIVPKGNP